MMGGWGERERRYIGAGQGQDVMRIRRTMGIGDKQRNMG